MTTPLVSSPPAADRHPAPADLATPAGATVVTVPLGRRVVLAGDLLLPPQATSSSKALATDLAGTLSRWQGPGVVVITGNLFATPCGAPALEAAHVEAALETHSALRDAIRAFTAGPERRLLVLPGWRDPQVATEASVVTTLYALGAEVTPAVDLQLATAAGERTVLVRPSSPAPGTGVPEGSPDLRRPWLTGIDRLEDTASLGRFVSSRTLYRRLGRFIWAPPLLAALVALVVRWAPVYHGVYHLVRRAAGARHLVVRAYGASWHDRLAFTLVAIALSELVLAAAVALASRRFWRAHAGPGATAPRPACGPPGGDPPPSSGLLVGGTEALDEARAVVEQGAAGLVVGGRLRAELTHLGPGFFACPGGTSELVREHRGRLGLPPVFLHHRQASWLELETGAELHVRLVLADADLPTSTASERLATAYRAVKGHRAAPPLHPVMVASWPRGASWPPAPDVRVHGARVRRVRRLAAAAIFVAGLLDLLWGVTHPGAGRLHLVTNYVPLGVARAAGALVALAGLGLMMLARGALRGQHRAWVVAVGVLGLSLVLHLLHGTNAVGLVLSAGVLGLLLVERDAFGATADSPSLRSGLVVLVVGALMAVTAATVAVEVGGHHHHLPAWPLVMLAAAERLVGYHGVALPGRIDGRISPTLLAVGFALAATVLYLFTRPVVDRSLRSSKGAARRAAELRARDIVRRHGQGTLDYFALRDDKQWFFYRDSLVAYAVYGTTCLVSPDPIGPTNEQRHVWDAFRRHADRNGWGVTVMGAAQEWLPLYRDSGMRHLYLGDEAVVDVQRFSLAGGKMKGLRQAVHRVERYGYTIEFLDPSTVDPEAAGPLLELTTRQRRGEAERGFSMTLSRLFDARDSGLLLSVAYDAEHRPVALCQFVPSTGVDGYSLDLMRRDPGEHPNGLIDFVLCQTIDHLRQGGYAGLSLNFAAMRSMLEGENGDGLPQRVERWALRRMSEVFPIESLWRFNSKYGPQWLPRYLVFDAPERFAPSVVAVLRAESLSEMPVVGRFLTPARS